MSTPERQCCCITAEDVGAPVEYSGAIHTACDGCPEHGKSYRLSEWGVLCPLHDGRT